MGMRMGMNRAAELKKAVDDEDRAEKGLEPVEWGE
jgi:hypothetical protein